MGNAEMYVLIIAFGAAAGLAKARPPAVAYCGVYWAYNVLHFWSTPCGCGWLLPVRKKSTVRRRHFFLWPRGAHARLKAVYFYY